MTPESINEPFTAECIVRRATAVDISAIKALEESAATAAHWSEAKYAEAVSSSAHRILVIEDGSHLLGFLAAGCVADEWEIENVVIARNARRRGLAGRLLAGLLDHAAKNSVHKLFLEVRESNIAARKFYEKWAFAEVGRRRGYYREPIEDAIIYRRILT